MGAIVTPTHPIGFLLSLTPSVRYADGALIQRAQSPRLVGGFRHSCHPHRSSTIRCVDSPADRPLDDTVAGSADAGSTEPWNPMPMLGGNP
jgi:hypothetical protein